MGRPATGTVRFESGRWKARITVGGVARLVEIVPRLTRMEDRSRAIEEAQKLSDLARDPRRFKQTRPVRKRGLRSALDLPDWMLVPRRGGFCVYFVRAGEHVKIGVTKDVGERLDSLRTGCAHRLTLLAAILGDSTLERALHERFSHLRGEGEWFRAAPDLIAFVDGLILAMQVRGTLKRATPSASSNEEQ